MSETSYNFSTNKSKKVKHIQGGEKKVMKKSLSLLLAIAMVFTMFSGVALAAEKTAGEQLKDLGVITGSLSGDLQEDSTWDRQDVAVILSRLLGLEAEAEATAKAHTYADATDSFYDGYLTWAKAEGYLEGHSEVRFGYNEAISNHQFVAVMLRALGYDTTGTNYEGAKALAVELGLVAEGTDFTSEAVRGTYYTVVLAALDTSMKDTEVTLGADLGLEGYVVEQGVSSVMPTDLKEVTVKFNQAVTASDDVTFKIKRGAATYSSTVEWNDDKTAATLTAVIKLPAADYTLEITGLEDETVTEEFTVVAETVSAVEVVSNAVALNDGSKITFKVSNQYGNDISSNVDHDELGAVSVYNVTQSQTEVTALENEESVIVLSDLETDGAEIGDVLRVTISHQGFTAQANIDVIELNANDVISLGGVILLDEDDERLNVSDNEFQLEYTLLDQYGEEATLTSNKGTAILINDFDGVKFASSDDGVIDGFSTNSDGELILSIAGSGDAIITAIVNQSGVIASTTVTVENDAQPEAAVISVPTTIVAGNDDPLELDVTLTDQFGDVVEDDNLITLTTDVGTVAINDDANVITLTLPGGITETTANEIEVSYDGEVIGSIEFDIEEDAEALEITSVNFPEYFELTATITVDNDQLNIVDQYGRDFDATNITVTTATYVTVASSVYLTAFALGTSTLTIDVDGDADLDVDVTVVASSDIESYTAKDIGTVYASNDEDGYNVAVTINGVDEDGNEVLLVTDAPDFITSSNSSVAKADSTGLKVIGVEEGTATISAWKDGVKVASGTVTVSEDAPVAQSVELDTDATITAPANASTIVTVKDQYGVDITSTTTLFFSGDNVTQAGVTSAGTADITVVTGNGLSATEEITVN